MSENSKPSVLKGNFIPARDVTAPDTVKDLSTEFEQEALKRLGGSIAFVSKKAFLLGMDDDANNSNKE